MFQPRLSREIIQKLLARVALSKGKCRRKYTHCIGSMASSIAAADFKPMRGLNFGDRKKKRMRSTGNSQVAKFSRPFRL